MLGAEGLTILGLPKPIRLESLHAYKQMAPDGEGLADLQIWDAVEAQLPSTFEAMYRFWCRAPLSPLE